METDAFRAGIERLLALARQKRTVILCAEAVWWRCHRSLIADYLKAAADITIKPSVRDYLLKKVEALFIEGQESLRN